MSEAADTDQTMDQRGATSRWKLWLLLNADRWRLAAGILAVVFVSLLLIGVLAPIELGSMTETGDPIETLFQAMVTGIVTGVTLVVTINQLVLSQELGPIGDQRDRMEGALAVRDEVADATDEPVTPTDPAEFVRSLVEAAVEQAEALTESVGDAEAAVSADVSDLAESMREDATSVTRRLEAAEFGTFDVLRAALDFNYSAKLHDVRALRGRHGENLPADLADGLDRLESTLGLYGATREHVKTLYFQWELINLSRVMLYAAVPALVVSSGMILFVSDPGVVPGATLGVDNLLLVVAAATTVALTPFVLLLVYVLRIATVAKRTLAIGPFVLRERDGE